MRFVIYDDESLEPITVIDLPLTDRCIDQRGRRWRVHVPPQFPLQIMPSNELQEPQIVDLWFEQFVRGKRVAWMCFTRAADLAMMLNPAFLPGQYSAVNELRDQVQNLQRLLLMVLR